MASSYRLCLLLEQEMASSMVCCEHLGETGSLGDTGRRRERTAASTECTVLGFKEYGVRGGRREIAF